MITLDTITMRDAAQAWLNHLQTRRRRPIKPSSAKTFESYIDKWISPCLGNLQVSLVGVAVLRDFIRQLDEAGLSPKSQTEIAGAVKAIIANCADDEGEPLYPRHWDNERLDLPIVRHSEQHTPVVTRDDIEGALTKSNQMYRCLFALAGGSGLRVGELLSIKLAEDGTSTFFDAKNALIRVRRTMWRGQEQTTKTEAGRRDVELPAKLSEFVAEFAGSRSGFLFGNGKCLDVTSARNALDTAIGKGVGYHAFRRFRTTILRKARCNEGVLRFWLGHAGIRSISDVYDRTASDEQFRRAEADRIGLGFDLP